MIQIVECSDEVIAKIPNIMGLLFEIYGKSEMKLFAIQNDDKLGFLAKVDNNCTYLDSNHNPIYFSLGVNEEIECIYLKPYRVCFGDEVFLIDDNNRQHFLSFNKLAIPDEEGYTGSISYRQYDEDKDVMCELTFQQMYRDGDYNPIYYFHTKEVDAVYIDEQYENSKRYHVGVLPKRAKYYKKVAFVNDEVGYTLTAMNEYGLLNVLKNGSYNLLREDRTVRYVKSLFIDFKGNYRDAWPFANLLKAEEIESLIKKYKFNTRIPDFIISLYNGENKDVLLIQEIVEKVRLLEKKLLQPENSRMCLTLKFEEE